MGKNGNDARAWPARDWADLAVPRVTGGRVTTICAECGQSFTPRRRDAAFCSRQCRVRAFRRRRDVRRCASCRRTIPASHRASARYCSDACRKRAYRRRQEDRGKGGGAS